MEAWRVGGCEKESNMDPERTWVQGKHAAAARKEFYSPLSRFPQGGQPGLEWTPKVIHAQAYEFLKALENLFRCSLFFAGTGSRQPVPATHRNEFSAGYSLASCTPALLASALPAKLILNQSSPFVDIISANGKPSPFGLYQRKGPLQGGRVPPTRGASSPCAIPPRWTIRNFP